MGPRSKKWVDYSRGVVVRTSTSKSQIDVNGIRKLIEDGVLLQPPTPQDVKYVLRTSEFKKVGSTIVENNGYTSSKLLRNYRVDHAVILQKLASAKPSPRLKRMLTNSREW